ncbi:MAG: 4-hydroxybenzoate 3-monooxygenase [Pseudomonadota bacterium]
MKTDVLIIGAGPSGLLLSQLLYQEGISSIIVERTSKTRVLSRIRAGVLERGTIEALNEADCDARLQKERIDHDGVILGFDGDGFEIPIKALTGHKVTVYGQTEITKDLIDACERRDQEIHWDCPDGQIERVDGDSALFRFSDAAGVKTIIESKFIAGCDGFHGVSRAAIAQSKPFERVYPFGWLGVLVDQPPVAHNVIYANHTDGFALASMRSETRARYYVQTAPDETLDDWPIERFWETYVRRMGSLADGLITGDPIEMSIAPLRSFVSEPMSYARLFLAGDAAHIVPPTGAKGLNLAIADTRRLAHALASFWQGNETPLNSYSKEALDRVWKVERFSWYLTRLMHQFPEDSAFEKKMQRAEFDYIRSSEAAQTMIAENYVGLNF